MVNTQPLNHIDEALLTTPSWLTNNTHTSQADPFFLRPKEVRVMLPDITNNKVMSFSFSKDNPTGAAMDGLHPHKGDSASAINAAMMEYKSELFNEYGYTNAVIDTYNELACYFAFVANEHNNNFGKPRRRRVRKKKKKANPLRAHFRDQNSPRNLTCTTRSARSRTHAKATKSKKMTWVDKLNLPQFVVCSLIGCSSCIALVASIFCLGLEGVAHVIIGTIGFFCITVIIAVIVPSVLNFLVRLVSASLFFARRAAAKCTSPPYVWYTETLLLAVVVASFVPDARSGFATICHNLSELAWPYLANLPTLAWPELPFFGGTRTRFRIICGTALLGYVFHDAESLRVQRSLVWLSKGLELLFVLFAAFLLDAVALLLRIAVVAAAQIIRATRNHRTAYLIVFLSIVQEAMAMDDDKASGHYKPPIFSGLRPDWTKWIISFTI